MHTTINGLPSVITVAVYFTDSSGRVSSVNVSQHPNHPPSLPLAQGGLFNELRELSNRIKSVSGQLPLVYQSSNFEQNQFNDNIDLGAWHYFLESPLSSCVLAFYFFNVNV